jgi:hypothetical protein
MIKEQASDTRVPGIILKTQSMNAAERILMATLGKVEKNKAYYLLMGGISYSIERLKIEARSHGWGADQLAAELKAFAEEAKANRMGFKRFLAGYDAMYGSKESGGQDAELRRQYNEFIEDDSSADISFDEWKKKYAGKDKK